MARNLRTSLSVMMRMKLIYRALLVSSFLQMIWKTLTTMPQKQKKSNYLCSKSKFEAFKLGANRKKSSSELSSPSSGARPISAIHNTKGDSDDTEFENTQVDSERYDTPDERHDSEPDTQDNQPKLKASLCQ